MGRAMWPGHVERQQQCRELHPDGLDLATVAVHYRAKLSRHPPIQQSAVPSKLFDGGDEGTTYASDNTHHQQFEQAHHAIDFVDGGRSWVCLQVDEGQDNAWMNL